MIINHINLSTKNKPFVAFQDLGHIAYQKAWDIQTNLHNALIERKLKNRHLPEEGQPPLPPEHHLLFCEHPPVYTLGRSGSMDHLLLDEEALAQGGFSFHKINRGGDITYHGPGQLVGYPIFDLDYFFTDVHRYIRLLEEAIIRTLAEYGVKGRRIEKFTGVWLSANGQLPERKIAAIGVHLSRWVTMHGFALNINPALDHFNHIVPCGIHDQNKAVSSLVKELGEDVDMVEVKGKLRGHLSGVFDFEYTAK